MSKSKHLNNSDKQEKESAHWPENEEHSKRGARPVGAVQNAIKILRFLEGTDRNVGATAIARATGMYPGTCYQVLRTLTADKLLIFSDDDKTYTLMPNLFGKSETGKKLSGSKSELERQEFMRVLAKENDVTVYLIGLLQNGRGVLIDFVHPASWKEGPVLASFESIYQGSMGRILTILLHKDEENWQPIFDKMPWEKSPDFGTWSKEVIDVAATGYAVDRGYRTKGLTVIATPICDNLGSVVMFLAALYPEEIPDEIKIAKNGIDLKLCAEKIRHETTMHAISSVSKEHG